MCEEFQAASVVDSAEDSQAANVVDSAGDFQAANMDLLKAWRWQIGLREELGVSIILSQDADNNKHERKYNSPPSPTDENHHRQPSFPWPSPTFARKHHPLIVK